MARAGPVLIEYGESSSPDGSGGRDPGGGSSRDEYLCKPVTEEELSSMLNAFTDTQFTSEYTRIGRQTTEHSRLGMADD